MRCPFCGDTASQVKDSRPTEDGSAIRRRRACPACGGRFTTFERVQLRELTVVKRSGKREPFDRSKLERSVAIATRKRDVAETALAQMISTIERELERSGEADIDSALIGEKVMRALRSIDDVAFVRFASVYKNFSKASDFEAFVSDLADSVRQRSAETHDGTVRPLTQPDGQPQP